jgi:chemotaxis protein methyltransferase WspC
MTGPADFENLLKASIGLNVASIGSSAVERAVQERLAACHLDNPHLYWERVRGSDAELQALIETVVVPETWFFRGRESLAALAHLAHDAFTGGPDCVLSLLSLPCSTGEEPYSMAMALLDAAISADRFRIDAVDISARVLTQAGRAVYGRNSFRGRELAFRDRHFDATAHGYRLKETVRRQVRFQQGNLFAAGLLPGVELYDVIFCRNVLIYFDRATQDRAIVVLKRLLKPNGVLFVAAAEAGLPTSHDFVSTNLPLAFAFRRSAAGPAQPKRVPGPLTRSSIGRPMPPPAPVLRPALAISPAPASASPPGLATDASAGLGEAMRLADQGHFVEAATSCAEHLRLHGPSAAAFHLMGLVREATGNQREAVDYYRKALYLEPNHYVTQIHLSLLMEKQGDIAGAQMLRNRARRLEQQEKTRHE